MGKMLIYPDELTMCTLCFAVITFDRSTKHYEWHESLNRRIFRENTKKKEQVPEQASGTDDSSSGTLKRYSQVVSLRLDSEFVTTLKFYAANHETTVSDLIREAAVKLMASKEFVAEAT